MTWQDEAACLDQTWMAQRGRASEARHVCGACPVLGECRRWVLADPTTVTIPGIVAGLSIEQRGGIECQCGSTVLKQNTRHGLCWSCYGNVRREKAG